MKEIKVYYGLPGTGKTTALLKDLKGFIKSGYGLEDVCFVTYRRKMSEDIVKKVKEEYDLFDDEAKDALYYFKTIHGVCKRINDPNIKVANETEQKKFCERYNYQISESDDGTRQRGNVFFTIKTWLVANNKPPSSFNSFPGVLEANLFKDEFLRMYDNWEKWKADGNMIDYDDMLVEAIEERMKPPTKILFVDEFQDMGPLQYKIYEIWRDSADYVIIGGDPNQAIYSFMGATPYFFMNEGEEKTILKHSYRLDENSWKFAKRIIERNGRVPEITTNDGGEKPKEVFSILPNLDLNKKTYILYRCNYMAEKVKKELDSQGIPYSRKRGGWTEKEINIYNCIFKLRKDDQEISKDELTAFLKILKRSYVNITKKRMGKILPSSLSVKSAKNYLNPFFTDKVISFPFNPDFTLKSGLSASQEKKIGKSLRKYKKIISNIDNVYIGTIHSVKGGESENTFLLGNITNRILRNIYNNNELCAEENRIFFVGSTRHKDRLFIIRDYLNSGKVFNFPKL